MSVKKDIIRRFAADRVQTIGSLGESTGHVAKDVKTILEEMVAEGTVARQGRSEWLFLMDKVPDVDNPLIPSGEVYFDYSGVVSKLRYCYRNGLKPLIIGPSGVGKTAAIRKVAELEQVPVLTTQFSVRTREHHFIGRLDTRPDGTIYFKKGPAIRAMENGWIWYSDEINVAEPDSLVRLNSILDYRQAIEIEGEYIKAAPGFWAVSSINPMDRYHAGTKELPGQIIRRFDVRIEFGYPDAATEFKIVVLHVPDISKRSSVFMDYLLAIAALRDSEDLPYHPGVSESITLARLITSGTNDAEAMRMTLIDVYAQWGRDMVSQVRELLRSRLAVEL